MGIQASSVKGNTGELYCVLSQLPSCYPEYVSFDCPRMLRVLSRIIADEKQAEVEDPEARRLRDYAAPKSNGPKRGTATDGARRDPARSGPGPVQAAPPQLDPLTSRPGMALRPPGARLPAQVSIFPLRPMVAVAPGARQGPRRGYCPETTQPRPRRRARAEASARVGCVLTQSPASISALVCRDRQPPGRCVARLVCIEVPGILPSASFRARPEGPCEPVPFAVEQRHFPSLFNHGHSLFPRMLPIRYFV